MMLVQELIDKLQKFDPRDTVGVHAEGFSEEIEEIEEIYLSSGVVVLDAEYYGCHIRMQDSP